MIDFPAMGYVALVAALLPFAAAVWLGAAMLLYRAPSARSVTRLISWAFTGSLLATSAVAISFVAHDDRPIVLTLGDWFASAGYAFHAQLLIDRLSAPMMVLTAAICGVIGRFSATYLVGEPGHARFFLLLGLFATGMFLLVMAGSLELLLAGWELVGITTMLLIAFFHERTFPVRNGLRAFTIYRVCDIGLLAAIVLMHHYAGTTVFVDAFGLDRFPQGRAPVAGAWLIALCLLWAASGKSALFPMGSWLPRAMEGPTPSSAIFYGALSVHAGAYLMLRMSPLLEHAWLARIAIVVAGMATALHGSLAQRVQSDIKSQLSYATSTQVGVIFIEIGLGWYRLALLHLTGHAVLRTLQFLRAPNVIHDVLALRSAAGLAAGAHQPAANSAAARWLYHLSLQRFHLDALLEQGVARPVVALAHALNVAELRWTSLLSGKQDVAPADSSIRRQPGEQPS